MCLCGVRGGDHLRGVVVVFQSCVAVFAGDQKGENTQVHCVVHLRHLQPPQVCSISISRSREDMNSSRWDPPKREETRKLLIAHHQEIKTERSRYVERRMAGLVDPSILSMGVDGATQRNFGLPHHHVQTHSTQKLRIGLHIMGCMVHGRGKDALHQLSPPLPLSFVSFETSKLVCVCAM